VADVATRAVAIVGEDVDEHGHAARCVALVRDRLVSDAFELTGPPLDGAVDRVVGDGRRLGLGDHRAERGVGVDVAAAFARRHFDLAYQLGEELSACLVLRALLVLDGGPLRMSAHETLTSCRKRAWSRLSPDSSGWNDATVTAPWRASTG